MPRLRSPDRPRRDAPASLGAVWTRRGRYLDIGSLVVSLVALTIEGVLFTLGDGGIGDVIGLTVSLLGVLIVHSRIGPRSETRARLWFGTAAIVLAPMVATTLSGSPLVTWTVAVFTAFSIALRGLPGLLVGVVVGSGVYVAIIYADGLGAVDPTAFVALTSAFTAAATGSALRSYARFQNEAEQRTRDAIASRDAAANQRIVQERLRIARDLHDLVGHEIAVLNIHLGVAEVNLPGEAAASRTALVAARSSVQSVLSETQRILHVLRTDDADDAGAPAADFSRIPDLLTNYRNAGVDVRAHLGAVPERIDPEVSTAAYRVIQEALTNAQRHGVGPVTIDVAATAREITITTANAKRLPVSPSTRRGYGLVGMRERVSSAGGRLEIHDTEHDFTAVATLRLDGSTLQ